MNETDFVHLSCACCRTDGFHTSVIIRNAFALGFCSRLFWSLSRIIDHKTMMKSAHIRVWKRPQYAFVAEYTALEPVHWSSHQSILHILLAVQPNGPVVLLFVKHISIKSVAIAAAQGDDSARRYHLEPKYVAACNHERCCRRRTATKAYCCKIGEDLLGKYCRTSKAFLVLDCLGYPGHLPRSINILRGSL